MSSDLIKRAEFLLKASSILLSDTTSNTSTNKQKQTDHVNANHHCITSHLGSTAKKVMERGQARLDKRNIKSLLCASCQSVIVPGINYLVRHNRQSIRFRQGCSKRRRVNQQSCGTNKLLKCTACTSIQK